MREPVGFQIKQGGRSPCGERGLKCPAAPRHGLRSRSLPVRGAWIEILLADVNNTLITSLPVRGAWIEISGNCDSVSCYFGRSPCGERGLKFRGRFRPFPVSESRSPCGERGLKCGGACASPSAVSSLPVRGAWIEMPFRRLVRPPRGESLPVRGAWIEIRDGGENRRGRRVAPRAGSVD